METIDQVPIQNAPKPEEAAKGRNGTAIAVEGLHKSFGSQKVLNGISLTVNRGETLAVLGRSGTGKSVLLRLIIGLEKPDSGSILIHGRDIAGLNLDQLGEIRMKMGFLFQHAALYDSLTVEENVAFPLVHHKRELSKSERGDRVKRLSFAFFAAMTTLQFFVVLFVYPETKGISLRATAAQAWHCLWPPDGTRISYVAGWGRGTWCGFLFRKP